MTSDLRNKETVEIEFYKFSADESPASTSTFNILNKMAEGLIMLDCINRFQDIFVKSKSVLELAGGQGWASCLVKRLFPEKRVVLSDISEFAVASVSKWEYLFQVKLDGARAYKSYEISEPDESFDLVFCYASAHHFAVHRRTLKEIKRILRPGGNCFFFNEPACQKWNHRIARWRLQDKRITAVQEDVLIYSRIKKIAEEVGLVCNLDFYPVTLKRDPFEAVYFGVQHFFPFLQKIFPCTINFQFQKVEQ